MKTKFYKIKRLHNKSKEQCTMCGKNFDLWDEQENFCLDRRIGYGSSHDGCQVKLQLCCGCFDRVLDMVIPLCRTTPITDLTDWEWPNVGKTADIMESRRKRGVALLSLGGSQRTATPTAQGVVRFLQSGYKTAI